MSDPILATRDVAMRFGGVVAVAGATVAIERGSITAIIGPNGAGKTTLFNVITGLYRPSAGTVVLRPARSAGSEHVISGAEPARIASLGVARTFQNIRLFTALSVLDNVRVGFHLRHAGGSHPELGPLRGALELVGETVATLVRSPGWRRREDEVSEGALAYLDFVGLGEHVGRAAGSLPYGMQRRVEIARALAAAPEILLLDEPAAGMNARETSALAELIGAIRAAGVTVTLIEHDMSLVMRVSQEIWVLDHGEVIARGAPAEIQANPRVIEAYLGAGIEGK